MLSIIFVFVGTAQCVENIHIFRPFIKPNVFVTAALSSPDCLDNTPIDIQIYYSGQSQSSFLLQRMVTIDGSDMELELNCSHYVPLQSYYSCMQAFNIIMKNKTHANLSVVVNDNEYQFSVSQGVDTGFIVIASLVVVLGIVAFASLLCFESKKCVGYRACAELNKKMGFIFERQNIVLADHPAFFQIDLDQSTDTVESAIVKDPLAELPFFQEIEQDGQAQPTRASVINSQDE